MCGVVGFFRLQESGCNVAFKDVIGNMVATLRHRGPDDSGEYLNETAGIALAHRRLSILDLSSAGHQPMTSACGRYVIVYNGEIYNHEEMRKELESHDQSLGWRGHADTETLLAAISIWGVESAVKKCVGMFAFAVWDRRNNTLTLARDRLGEKPLYYGWFGGVFLFASEIKALHKYPGFSDEIDRDALYLYLRHNCVPAPYSIYKGVFKLPPGNILTVKAGNQETLPIPYWSLCDVAENGQRHPFDGSDEEAVDELERLLGQSIKGQMIADVPLGAFLSGGIDSSSVVALMQAYSSRPVQTFTIGSHDTSYNEATQARAVAAHLGTDHTELYVSSAEAMQVIPRLPELYDEPFADSSQIPTFLVSQLAKQQVTVSLSGDGGDELFGGYNRHHWAAHMWRRVGYLPRPLRVVFAAAMQALPPQVWDSVFMSLEGFLPRSMQQRNPGDKLHKLAEIVVARGEEEVYLNLVSHWKNPGSLVKGGMEPKSLITGHGCLANLDGFENNMMYLDTVTYLPDDILTKVDRAAMGVSLESRIPMLDHRVVEFAWRLPLEMKIRKGQGKWLLRQMLYRYVPNELVERPKAGFGLPLGDWLRGPLRDWAEALLDEGRLVQEGFFHPGPIRKTWDEHLSGRYNRAYHLWDVLMFQSWLEQEGMRGASF